MQRVFALFVLACVMGLVCVGDATAAKVGAEAPEFPPGEFSDGRQHSLADYRGQVVVLFFYEKDCPTCRDTIPDRNATVLKYQGKPVAFFGIAAGDTPEQAKSFIRGTGLAMPVFVDRLSLMEKRYGTTISLKNIYQVRVIDPNGKVVANQMSDEAIDRALEMVKQDFDASAYHDKLSKVVAGFNAGEFAAALRELRRFEADRDEAVSTSAASLKQAVLAKAQGWKDEADGLAESDPFTAGKLYAKAGDAFPAEELGKQSKARLRELSQHAAVKDEVAAQKMYARMTAAVNQIDKEQVPELVKFASQIAEKYPDTPTGKKAAALAKDLAS